MPAFKNNKVFIGIILIAFFGLLLVFYIAISAKREVSSGKKIEVKEDTQQEKTVTRDSVEDEASKVDNLEASNASAVLEAEKTTSSVVRGIDSGDHVIGDLKAPVKIITYSDFDCPFCADFNDTLKRISTEYKDKVVIAYRHLPQRQHANSWSAATAAECASEQGKFWEMHDKLFALKKQEKLDSSQYVKIAKDLKLDQIKFLECVSKDKFKDKILAQYMEAKTFGVIGTPGTFINGLVFPGAVPYDDFTDSSGLKREGMRSIVERMLK